MSLPKTQKQYHLPELDQLTSIDAIGKPKDAAVPTPTASEVLVKVRAVSLNYRDLAIATGNYPLALKSVVPTSDIAGEIVSLGSDVDAKRWKKGDRVMPNFNPAHIDGDATPEKLSQALGGVRDGGLQQYIAVPANCLVEIPEWMSFDQASTLPCAAVTAYNALFGPSGHPLQPGDTVLLQGTGGVSVFALQIAKAAGATVIITSGSDEKLKDAKKLGADHGINYKTTPEWAKEALKLTNGRGVDHIVEVGGPGTIEQSFEAIAFGGVVSTIGFVAAANNKPPPNLAMLALTKGAVLRGILIGSVRQFEALMRLIIANKDRFSSIVDNVFKFEEAVEAYKYLESQKHFGKVVIKVAE